MSIFVSYRRDDAAGHAGRLCDDLADRFGAAEVFHDIDSIAPGEDFVSSIQRAISSADVVLAVIGPDWAMVSDSQGQPRLSDPADVVRMEIATALRTGKPVIPVLAGGAARAGHPGARRRPGRRDPTHRPAVAPVAPAVVTTLAPAELGTTSFTFGAPQIEAYSDRHLVGIPIHAVNNDRYDAPFSDREFRMLIDGDPRAPVGFLGEVIPATASADATLWWEVPLGSGSLVLRIEHQGAQAEVPVTN